jgi:hypothetical protein
MSGAPEGKVEMSAIRSRAAGLPAVRFASRPLYWACPAPCLSLGGGFARSPGCLRLGVSSTGRLACYPGSLSMLMIGLIAVFGTRTWQNSGAGRPDA